MQGHCCILRINSAMVPHLWRAVDQDGNELDVLVTKQRDKKAAIKFFKKLFKTNANSKDK